jgi:alpha-tubulin suppressor-like RCC1 family protein
LLGTSTECGFDSQPYSSVVAGNNNTCAIDSAHQVDCCGKNDHGQSEPPGDLTFSMLRPGWNHACGLTLAAGSVQAGEVRCWGIDQEHIYNFGQVDDQPAGLFVALGGRDDTTCAIRASTEGSPGDDDDSAGGNLDAIHCWGRSQQGQASAPSAGEWIDVTVGAYHGCALAADGSVTCWGQNDVGQASPP